MIYLGAADTQISFVRRLHARQIRGESSAFVRGVLAGFSLAANDQPESWILSGWANEAHFLAWSYRKDLP